MKTEIIIKLSALKAVSMAMAQSDVRYYLNGLYIDATPGDARAVATDGHRLNAARIKAQSVDAGSFIMPRDFVLLLTKVKEMKTRPFIEISYDGANIIATYGELTYQAKSIEGTFPSYRRVIPAECPVDACHNPLNTDYVLQAKQALSIYQGSAKANAGNLQEPIPTAASSVLFSADFNFLALIMPMRAGKVDHAETSNALQSWRAVPSVESNNEMKAA